MVRSPCCEKTHTNKGAWTKEEDQRLINYIKVHGEGSWRSLPKAAGLLRCGKSCRLRWINYLRPDLKRGNFSEEEDSNIIKLHSLLGNKWSLIAGRLPGRTDNEIKNHWNTHLKRKLISRGIDPQTQRPLISTACPGASTAFRSSIPTTDNSSTMDNTKCSSSSSATEEDARQVLDLELSIGLPSPAKKIKISSSATSFQAQPKSFYGRLTLPTAAPGPDACLCWRLGFPAGEYCGNCRS